jgi:Tol biopolymer transport system component
MNKVFRIIFFVLTAGGLTFAQFTQFHPELTWYTIKGKHVQVHYHEGAERTAKVVAKIGDEVWDPITSLYNYEPDVVHYVIKDIDDYSNGATYFFDNKIEIWSSALDFDLRGTHNWLRNVISHEFTHMVQIQASLKTTRTIPAVYLQWLNYEDERRPDILYGFPNIIMSYPIAFINMPSWFAEGTAQYMRKDFNYDNWDSHRDMILRSYVLDGNMLTWNQMGVFDKTSLGNESVYNSGFALTRYLSQQYGEDKLRLITNALGKWKNYTIDAAFKDVLGKDGNEIYGEWKAYLTKNYNERIKDVKANFVAGDTLAQIGFGNFYPSFSEDGKKFIYISNKMGDYMGLSSVFEYDIETKKEEIITEGVRSTVSYIPGQKKIIFAKLTDKNPNFYNVHDLYVYDIEKKEESRLTNGLRANQPSVSPDGKKIVFLFQTDGTTNVGLVDIDGKNFKQLTVFHNGEQTYNPKFSPDSRYVIFDYSNEGSRDIAKVNVDATGFAFVIKTASDERNPVFDKEGNLIYSSDETGIYNLYKYNFSKAEKTRLTNVTGGAFMPTVNKNGDILYAGYTSTGYKIFYLKNEVSKKVVDTLKYTRMNNPPLGEDKPKGDMARFDLERLKHFDDTQLPDYKPEKYSGAFSKVSIFPFIRYDNYSTSSNALDKIKPGVYLSSSDMLNRYGFFAGASINKRMERDLFLIFDYRNKIPLLYNIGIKPELSVELYNVSRKANTDVAFGADTVSNVVKYDYSTKTDVTYNLMECDFVIKHMLFARDNMLELRFIYSRYNAMLGSFILPDETLYPASDDVYLIGRNLQLKYSIRNILPAVDEEINPIGYTLDLTYNYEFNKFNKDSEYEVEDGILKPIYKNYDFHRLEVNSAIHMPTFKNHTLSARIRMGTIFGPDVPDFFDFYLGGMAGMKAYPFYAISGNEIGWLNITYRFPLFRNIDARLGHLYLDKIFFSVYGDLGNAWYGNMPSLSDFKKGAGAELRIGMTSFYMFPTNIFFNASYGFDKFERVVRDKTLSYGKEWRLYAGVLFGFDF